MNQYSVSFQDDEGEEIEITAETVGEIHSQLKEINYEGSSLNVRNDSGALVGFVNASGWWYL